MLRSNGSPGSGLLALLAHFFLGGNIVSMLGGGPFRHFFRTYEYFFNTATTCTSLLSPAQLANGSVSGVHGQVTLGEFSDMTMLQHEPAVTGADDVVLGRRVEDALAGA